MEPAVAEAAAALIPATEQGPVAEQILERGPVAEQILGREPAEEQILGLATALLR